MLAELFPGVDIGLTHDAGRRCRAARRNSILSFTPHGTATSGSVYVRGRDGTQWVVRVLGVTGANRVLRYVPATGEWVMPPNDSERRRAVRRVPHPDETLSRVRLRTGRELAVVDISSSGALVEGADTTSARHPRRRPRRHSSWPGARAHAGGALAASGSFRPTP